MVRSDADEPPETSVTIVGLNERSRPKPEGDTAAERLTVPEKPFKLTTVIVVELAAGETPVKAVRLGEVAER